jgi:hypothetical protein
MYNAFIEGVVRDTNDPQQMGRIKVWCPAVDGENQSLEYLPWATYVSPLAGQAYDYPAGAEGKPSPGPVAYGFWAVPKVGATVIIGFLYGDPNLRIYMGSYFPDHGNRSLPAGRNYPSGPQSDTIETIEPATSNMNVQFQGKLTASEALTRGVYERQVAQALTDKDGKEGYQQGVVETGSLDPQTYCLVTPGHHALIMQDSPTNSRVRIKTGSGNQVILDDANERIYVSTAKGQTWIELDQDGRVHVYAADSIDISSGGDINIGAKGSVNVQAGGNINLNATGHARVSACKDISVAADANVNITTGAQMNLLAKGTILQTGSKIHLNGPAATKAPCADKIVEADLPQPEPWTRKASKVKRGRNWKA